MRTLISGRGFSAHQLVSVSDRVGLRGWGDKDEDLLFGQDAFFSGQLAQQWKPRRMAQEAALRVVATSQFAGM